VDRPGIPTLRTPRLVLRPLETTDLPALVALHAEESFWWYPLRAGMSEGDTGEFLTRVLARYESDGFGIEALIDRAGGAMIGWAGLAVPHFLPEILPAVEVGWRLTESYRGRGLATEAGSAAVDWGFTEGGLERIVSIYEPENTSSGRVMERLGFTRERTTMGPRGLTAYVMELTRQRWAERTAGSRG
jgi:RimJ/RimL family protein N-acetyltransferase